MPYSAYCLFFVPPNKRLDPVLCSIGKWLIASVSYTAQRLVLSISAQNSEKLKCTGFNPPHPPSKTILASANHMLYHRSYRSSLYRAHWSHLLQAS
jgi:hypothetical protein